MPRERSPQEKKALELARDRRNSYGENDKSSRKAIRRRKRSAQHDMRQAARQALHRDADDPDRAMPHPGGRWRKHPDAPLAEFLRDRRERRLLRALQPRFADPALLDRLEAEARAAGLADVDARKTFHALRVMLHGTGEAHAPLSDPALALLQRLVKHLL